MADDVQEGYLCDFCERIIDKSTPGYSRLCDACAHDIEEDDE